MTWRLVWLACLQLVGWALATWLAWERHEPAQAFDVLLVLSVVTGIWLVSDHWRATRLLRWLSRGEPRASLRIGGTWADVADAIRGLDARHGRQLRAGDDKHSAFLQAMQALPVGMVMLDELGRMEWFNVVAAEHFGFKSPNDLEQDIVNLVRDPAFVQYWMQQHSGNGIEINGRQHSLQRPVRLSVQYFPFGDGKRLLMSRDITAIEQADRMRRDFVANVSHEVRTPLTVLSGFVETLQTVPLEREDTEKYLDLMAQQASRMQTLVHDLLVLSRLEGSPSPDLQQQVDMRELLARCVDDAKSLSRVLGAGDDPLHAISLRLPAADAIFVSGSAAELHSAIGNLLSNAVRYTPAGGEIVAALAVTPEGELEVSVRDNGPGIAREHLPRLTERFYRVDRSRSRETGGTGLGLAIVKHIVQRHGAALRVDSTVGAGSCFTLVLPALRVRTHAGGASTPAAQVELAMPAGAAGFVADHAPTGSR